MITPHEHQLYKTAILDDESALYQCSLCSYFIIKRVAVHNRAVSSDFDKSDKAPAVNSTRTDTSQHTMKMACQGAIVPVFHRRIDET